MAAAVTASFLTACNTKKVAKKETDISIVEVEPTTSTTGEIVGTVPAETYPDFPISYPEIEKKRTGNVYEAEDALMTEGLVFDDTIPESKNKQTESEEETTQVERKPYSGDGYVTGFKNDGSTYVIFDVDVPSNQHYDISFCIYSDKEVNCRFSVNDKESASFLTKKNSEFILITLYGVFLTKGKTKIELRPLDGDIKLDYMKHPIVNTIWLLLFGWEFFLVQLISGIFCCITIIGIPAGIQAFKFSKLSLAPFGAQVKK